MNAVRPIAPDGVIFTLVWFAMAAVILASLLYAAARRQSFLGKLLYSVGVCVC
jgi:hypothetical protein